MPHVKNHRDQERPRFHLSLSFLQANLHMRHLIAIHNYEQEHLVSLLHKWFIARTLCILRGSQCRRKGGILGGGAQNRAQKGRAAREVWGYAAPESFKKCYFQRSPTAICNLCVSQITSHTVLAKQCKLKKVWHLRRQLQKNKTERTISQAAQASVLPVRDS